MGKGKIPDRWIPYSPMGTVVPGTCFLACKVPLKETLLRNLPLNERFGPDDLMKAVPNLGLLIDLTNTNRYYLKEEFTEHNIQYQKILCPGQVVPPNSIVKKFFGVVDGFLKSNKDPGAVIAVHCTHGVNRTGYFISRYMIEKLKFEPTEALKRVGKARGHCVERQTYIDDLQTGCKGGSESDAKKCNKGFSQLNVNSKRNRNDGTEQTHVQNQNSRTFYHSNTHPGKRRQYSDQRPESYLAHPRGDRRTNYHSNKSGTVNSRSSEATNWRELKRDETGHQRTLSQNEDFTTSSSYEMSWRSSHSTNLWRNNREEYNQIAPGFARSANSCRGDTTRPSLLGQPQPYLSPMLRSGNTNVVDRGQPYKRVIQSQDVYNSVNQQRRGYPCNNVGGVPNRERSRHYTHQPRPPHSIPHEPLAKPDMRLPTSSTPLRPQRAVSRPSQHPVQGRGHSHHIRNRMSNSSYSDIASRSQPLV